MPFCHSIAEALVGPPEDIRVSALVRYLDHVTICVPRIDTDMRGPKVQKTAQHRSEESEVAAEGEEPLIGVDCAEESNKSIPRSQRRDG